MCETVRDIHYLKYKHTDGMIMLTFDVQLSRR